nr:AI-2E family transporter [Entomobacter blattae]
MSSTLQFALIAAFCLLAIWLIGDILMVLFASTLVAVILCGLTRKFQKFIPLPYWLALTCVVVLLMVALSSLIWFSGPEIGEQAIRLRTALTTQAAHLRETLHTSPLGNMLLNHLPRSLGGNRIEHGNEGMMGIRLAGSMSGIISSAFGTLGTLAVILMAGLYFALSPSTYTNGILRLVSKPYRMEARKYLEASGKTLWAWTAGQSLDMLVVGIFSAMGLWFLNVPLAFALGVVAGLANFIPYIGAIIGAIPAVIIGLSQSTQEGIFVLLLYMVIQFVEGNILAPIIQRHAVHMPPGITILSQTIFGTILGIPGLILATPLTALFLAVGDKATPPLTEEEKL